MFRPAIASIALFLTLPVSAFAAELTVTAQSKGGAAPIGAQRVPFLVVTLENSCDAATTIESVNLRHRGLGSIDDIARMYFMQGNRRVSVSASSFNDAGFISVRLRRFVLQPCAKATVDLMGDFSNDASPEGQHTFEIVTVEAGATVTVRLNPQSGSVTTKAGQAAATVRAKMLPLQRNLTYGTRRVVARLQLTGDRSKNQLVHIIVFTNEGSAENTDLQNFFLERSNGEALSGTVASMDGDRVELVLDEPLELARNQTLVLNLRADVRASSRKTVRFVIEEPGDIRATVAGRAR